MSALRNVTNEAGKILLPLAILALGVGGFLVLGRSEPPPSRDVEKAVPVVATAPVAQHTEGLTIEVFGTVVPYREVQLAAEVAGRIVYKNPNCRAGNYVPAGTLLLTIDPRDYRLQLEQNRAELEQKLAKHQELKVELANTQTLVALAEKQWELQKSNLQRTLQLRARNAASTSDVEEAQRAELNARNSLISLQNQVKLLQAREAASANDVTMARAKVAKAELELERTKVHAPLDGVIVKCDLEQDDHVAKGTVLAVLEDTSQVEVRCNLRVKELSWLWLQRPREEQQRRSSDAAQFVGGMLTSWGGVQFIPGVVQFTAKLARDTTRRDYEVPVTKAQVVYEIGDGEYIWDGVLSRFEGIGVNTKTRTVPCRVLVPEPRTMTIVRGPTARGSSQASQQRPAVAHGRIGGNGPPALVRGMFVTVRILARPVVRFYRIPEQALRPGDVVWCVRNGRLTVVPVEVAHFSKQGVILHAEASDLRASDRVVLTPLAHAVDGLEVREKR